jgi:GPH family glycoside/pentoside/hexuronide:cation symporter
MDGGTAAVAMAVEQPAHGQIEGPLPLPTKLLYSISSLGAEALIQSRAAWLLYFYAPPADSGLKELLPIGLVGLLLAAMRVVDSFDSLLVGWWSDRTRSRLGRRLPFVLAGAPFWAIFAVLAFFPPADAPVATIAVWFALTTELYSLFATVAGGPYEALMPEIARTSRQRLDLVSTRVYFGVAGAAVGLVASGALVDRLGVQGMMVAVAALALATRYLGVAGVWRRVDRDQAPATLPLKTALKATFANKQFLAFLPTFVLFQTGLQMLTGMLPFYARATLGVDEPGRWVALLMGVTVVSVLLAVPVFGRLAGRTSKRHAYRRAMLLTGLAFPMLAVAGFLPGIPPLAQVLAAMALVGAPMAGVYLFPAALTADIADHDAALTGQRREASYFGAQGFVEKITSALSPLVLAGLLSLGNTAADPLGVRLVGPVAAGFVLLGWFLFRRYRLPDDVGAAAAGPLGHPPVVVAVATTADAEAGPPPEMVGGVRADIEPMGSAVPLSRPLPRPSMEECPIARDPRTDSAASGSPPASRFTPTPLTRLQARIARRIVLVLSGWVFRFQVRPIGLEHVPPGEPLIVAVGPHRGWLDAFLVMMALPPGPRPWFFGSAEALLGTRWRRAILRLFGGIVPVSTVGKLNREALETSVEILAAGNRLVIFPEGWGTLEGPAGEIGEVRRGISFLAARSGRRVLPVGLVGTRKLWRGKELPVRIGPLLPALAANADRAEAQAFADAIHAALTAILPPAPPEPADGKKPWPWLSTLLD